MGIGCRILYLTLILGFLSCQSSRKASAYSKDLLYLSSLMSGDFSNYLQARKDSLFQDVLLRMCPIWTADAKGVWLYVEQSFSVNPGQPYRQRVYKLERLSGRDYISRVYTLPDETKFVGACQHSNVWQDFKPSDLAARDGCTIYLKRLSKDHFKGATRDSVCESRLRGASFATSEVEIKRDVLITLDRGYAKNGKQVWGSKNGPYLFERLPVK